MAAMLPQGPYTCSYCGGTLAFVDPETLMCLRDECCYGDVEIRLPGVTR